MRILLVHQYFHEKDVIGGSRFNEMVDKWASEGHQITVLAGMIHYGVTSIKPEKYRGKLLVKEQVDENVEVIRCHVSESYNVNFIGRLWAYFSFVFFSILGGLFKAKGKYNVMLVTSPPLFVGITGYLISRVKNIPLVFEIRDLWPESAIDTGVLKNSLIIKVAYWFEKFIYRKAKLINVLTPAFKKTLLNKKKVNKEKIIFIPNAADFNISESLLLNFDSSAFRKELNWEDKFVILYVGAHGVANHLIQMLDTAEILRDRKDILLACVGDGMQKKSLLAEAKKRELSNIQFFDPVPKQEIFKFILAADVGTSVLKKADTFKTVYSNKTFDYMGCKKPILMVIDGVSRELVEKANCGVFVNPENPIEFAEKIKYFQSRPDMLKEFGENGYNYAREHFDRAKLAMEYLDHIKRISK